TTVVAKTAPAATATAAASMTVRYARRERFCVASHRSPMPSFHASAQRLDGRPEHRACMSLGGQARHCPGGGAVWPALSRRYFLADCVVVERLTRRSSRVLGTITQSWCPPVLGMIPTTVSFLVSSATMPDDVFWNPE